jgi:hypothetical protein
VLAISCPICFATEAAYLWPKFGLHEASALHMLTFSSLAVGHTLVVAHPDITNNTTKKLALFLKIASIFVTHLSDVNKNTLVRRLN